MTKETFYRKLIARYQAGDLTQPEFCNQENISLNSLKSWIKKINKLEKIAAFVAIENLEIPSQNLEIIYPNGVKIRIEKPLNFDVISQLIQC